jgi:hypothetical protein
VIDSDLDIRVPSIGLLSEDSTDITTLKNNINNLNDYNKTHVQLIYHNKTFGDVSPFYNPLPSQGWFLIITINISTNAIKHLITTWYNAVTL